MIEDVTDFIIGCIAGVLCWFFGGIDGFMKVLLTFTVIDYLSGVSAAYVRHELSSEIGFKGITKKIFIFALVGIAHVIDKNLLGDTQALKTAVCLFYVGNEGVSILENAVHLGLPVPEALKEKLLHFTKEDEVRPSKNKTVKK